MTSAPPPYGGLATTSPSAVAVPSTPLPSAAVVRDVFAGAFAPRPRDFAGGVEATGTRPLGTRDPPGAFVRDDGGTFPPEPSAGLLTDGEATGPRSVHRTGPG